MLTEKHRADRRRAIQALVACAAAVALTVSLTGGVGNDQLGPTIPTQLGFTLE